jgi:hypothetical protein
VVEEEEVPLGMRAALVEAAVVLLLVAVAAVLTVAEAVIQATAGILASSPPVVTAVRVKRVLLGTP